MARRPRAARRARPGLDLGILEHRGIHVAVLLVAASSCLLASLRRDTERLPWLLIGLGLAGWTAGEAVYVTVMWDDTSPPIPSPADYGYLLLPALLLPGLWLLLRGRAAAVSRTLWADGVTVGLAVSSVSAALVFQTLYTHVSGDPVGVGVALAYPLTDMVMLAAIAGSLAGIGWRLDRRWGLLAGGIVAFWLADSLYAISAVAGTYDAGGWFDIGWWGGLLAIGVAAWQPNRSHVPADGQTIRFILVPLGFGLIGLGLLVYAAIEPLNALAVSLAALSLAAVMVRLLLTFKAYVAMIGQSRGEALTDSLTGLGNRRALTDALTRGVAAADDADPLVLVLFDLDGFKHYNDCFGHPAGDALLERLGGALSRYIDGRGDAYRMGGDEFCVLVPPRPAGGGADHPRRRRCADRARRGLPHRLLVRLGRAAARGGGGRRGAARRRPADVRAEALASGAGRVAVQERPAPGARRAPSRSRGARGRRRAARRGDRDGPRARHRGRQALPPRRRAARHRQDRDPRVDPAQARPAQRRRVGVHPASHDHRRAHPARGPGARGRRAARPVQPRALGRRRLPRCARGPGHPARVTRRGDRRCLRRHDCRSPLLAAQSVADALAELRRCAGSQFDPVAVEAFHEACAAHHPAARCAAPSAPGASRAARSPTCRATGSRWGRPRP